MLIPAYYGVYAYAWRLRNETGGMAGWRVAAGWCAAIFFIAIGFLFANGLSLMDHVERWPDLWTAHSMAGAALGTALNVGDLDALAPLALDVRPGLGHHGRLAAGRRLLVQQRPADEAYRRWALGFARKLYAFAIVWAAAAGTWYVFGTWSTALWATMFEWPLLPLTVATAIAPGLPWALMMTADRYAARRATIAAIAVCQFGVLGINALSRQVVQNANLKPFLDVSAQPVDIQWAPLAMFLVIFVLGLAAVGVDDRANHQVQNGALNPLPAHLCTGDCPNSRGEENVAA